ncbi:MULTISPECIES: nucleotidyltransferase family protein [Bacillus]|uniref:nucleotidyltransferase family protein n=1 Tax=Bacillus TaxID=1386 RepID=UPI000DC42324|nr:MULTISPECIES: nucleotidyltransferase family protein [Bacillus]RAN76597.1 hypothetical protein B5P42_23000 [Bacillus sp. SRB_331]USL15355.1 nucleotidyltransferase family protein [Bacillus thuringiensis]
MKGLIVLKLEYELIILLTKQDLNESEINRLKELLGSHLEWDRIIGLLYIHRVLGIAWLNLKKYYSQDEKNRCAMPRLFKLLNESYNAQKEKFSEQLEYTYQVCKALEDKNIRYVVLKGVSLSGIIYKDGGLRDFNDNDILIHPNDLDRAKEEILSLGYVQGNVKHHIKIVKPTRRELLIRRMNSHEVIPLVKDISKDSMLAAHHVIDLHFSVNLMTKNHNEDIVEKFLNHRIKEKIQGKMIYSLDYNDMFIFLCEHFYKEAKSVRDLNMYKDLLLYKICDIYHILLNKNLINWNTIVSTIEEYEMEKQVEFALTYVKRIFKCDISPLLNKNSYNEDFDIVYQYDSEEVAYKHNANQELVDRVFDISRPRMINEINK